MFSILPSSNSTQRQNLVDAPGFAEASPDPFPRCAGPVDDTYLVWIHPLPVRFRPYASWSPGPKEARHHADLDSTS